jgi:hypothetical protein
VIFKELTIFALITKFVGIELILFLDHSFSIYMICSAVPSFISDINNFYLSLFPSLLSFSKFAFLFV